MNVPREALEVVHAWLRKAGSDIEAARRILAVADECPFDAACFHCQQAVEKSLKAWLTLRGKVAPRIHDLEPLYQLAASELPGLPSIEDVIALNPYGVQVRYIDDWLEPSETDARASFAVAESILLLVREQVPELD